MERRRSPRTLPPSPTPSWQSSRIVLRTLSCSPRPTILQIARETMKRKAKMTQAIRMTQKSNLRSSILVPKVLQFINNLNIMTISSTSPKNATETRKKAMKSLARRPRDREQRNLPQPSAAPHNHQSDHQLRRMPREATRRSARRAHLERCTIPNPPTPRICSTTHPHRPRSTLLLSIRRDSRPYMQKMLLSEMQILQPSKPSESHGTVRPPPPLLLLRILVLLILPLQ